MNEIKIEKVFSIGINIDYVKCDECGEVLDYGIQTDSFGDIQIYVTPHKCAQEDQG